MVKLVLHADSLNVLAHHPEFFSIAILSLHGQLVDGQIVT